MNASNCVNGGAERMSFDQAHRAFTLDDLARDVARLPTEHSDLVASPPGPGPGSWAGAPSAVLIDDEVWLAYRLRLPVGQGRGYANVIARSPDGVSFETVAMLHKDTFGAASLERPTLVVADGIWRVYVSCSTPTTYHWRVDLVEAVSPEKLERGNVRTVLAGGSDVAIKDPVILRADGTWHLWASVHPLTDLTQTDRMTTEYATSDDGIEWAWQGTALAGRAGKWDARGVRVTAVLLNGGRPLACYDGRKTAGENWEERTGLAIGGARFGAFSAVGSAPVAASRYSGGGLRYVTVVQFPNGDHRYYYEATRADGAHELRTLLVPAEP